MERETKTVTTPFSNVQVVLKSYITGLEKRNIKNAALPANYVFDASNPAQNLNPAQLNSSAEDAKLSNIIVSVNGITTDIPATVLLMRSEDSDFILAEVEKVFSGISGEKKTS